MKKKSLLLTGILSAIGALALLVSNVKTPIKADASLTSHIYLEDKFNNPSFKGSFDSDMWVANGSHIRQSEDGESYLENPGIAASSGDGLFFGTKGIVHDVEYIQFDMMMPADMPNNYWIGIKFLTNSININDTEFAEYTYNAAYAFTPVNYWILHSNYESVSMSGSSYSEMTTYLNIKGYWISYKMVPSSESSAKLYLAKQGEAFNNSKYITLTSTNTNKVNFLNCQFGFQSSNPASKYCVDNVKIKGSDVNVDYTFDSYDEDESVLENKLLNDEKRPFTLICSSDLYIPVGTNANESLVSKKATKDPGDAPTGIKVLDVSFTAYIPSSASTSDAFGFAFGLDETSSALSTAGGLVEFSKSNIIVKLLKDGALVQEGTANTTTLQSTVELAQINLIVWLNGNLEVKVNDDVLISLTQKVNKYMGHFGIFALSSPTARMEVDDVRVGYETYYVPVTKSVTHNFSNNFWGNEGYEDFYVAAGGYGSLDAKDGKLTYERCADGAMFGSAHQYDCFILDYKLCSIKTGPEPDDPTEVITDYTRVDKWTGLDLSRSVREFSNYGSYLMVLVKIVPKETDDSVWAEPWVNPAYPGTNADYNQVTRDMKRSPIPADMFRAIQYDGMSKQLSDIKESDAVCFRWISYGNKLELYLKTAGDIEFTKYATFNNIDLQGYFCLTCTGYTTVQYDDFSMANTSPIYICADNEEPETIVQTETEIIYDPANVDVNLAEEIKINTEETEKKDSDEGTDSNKKISCGGSIVASSILLPSLSLGGIGLLVIRKKGKKHEK